jgi:hypothetical protein
MIAEICVRERRISTRESTRCVDGVRVRRWRVLGEHCELPLGVGMRLFVFCDREVVFVGLGSYGVRVSLRW